MLITAISGSLRKESLNTALLRALEPMTQNDVELSVTLINELPMYNPDIAEDPASVVKFRDAISAADGVIVATPEYNYSITGSLKNAIDWTSRPAYNSVWARKKVGIVGAADSMVGTSRAQAHMRQILFGMSAAVFPYPEVLVGGAFGKFEHGQLTDERTAQFLKSFLDAFSAWVRG